MGNVRIRWGVREGGETVLRCGLYCVLCTECLHCFMQYMLAYWFSFKLEVYSRFTTFYLLKITTEYDLSLIPKTFYLLCVSKLFLFISGNTEILIGAFSLKRGWACTGQLFAALYVAYTAELGTILKYVLKYICVFINVFITH